MIDVVIMMTSSLTILTAKVMRLPCEIENIPALAKVGCWNKVQGLMNVEVWLEKPIADNLNSLKLASFANNPSK